MKLNDYRSFLNEKIDPTVTVNDVKFSISGSIAKHGVKVKEHDATHWKISIPPHGTKFINSIELTSTILRKEVPKDSIVERLYAYNDVPLQSSIEIRNLADELRTDILIANDDQIKSLDDRQVILYVMVKLEILLWMRSRGF